LNGGGHIYPGQRSITDAVGPHRTLEGCMTRKGSQVRVLYGPLIDQGKQSLFPPPAEPSENKGSLPGAIGEV
jgi:hypothetical protein